MTKQIIYAEDLFAKLAMHKEIPSFYKHTFCQLVNEIADESKVFAGVVRSHDVSSYDEGDIYD